MGLWVGGEMSLFFDICRLRFPEVTRVGFSVRLMGYLGLTGWEPLASRWQLQPLK